MLRPAVGDRQALRDCCAADREAGCVLSRIPGNKTPVRPLAVVLSQSHIVKHGGDEEQLRIERETAAQERAVGPSPVTVVLEPILRDRLAYDGCLLRDRGLWYLNVRVNCEGPRRRALSALCLPPRDASTRYEVLDLGRNTLDEEKSQAISEGQLTAGLLRPLERSDTRDP